MADTPWKDLVDCDVQDKERLALFRAKLREWKKCLNDENDSHSIFHQITTLMWDDTIWRTFNEARGLSEQTHDPSTGLQGTLIDLFDRAFLLSHQPMAIRRLTEPHQYDPKRAVYSLGSLLGDICNNQHLFTRENYICYDGLTYEQVAGEKWQDDFNRSYRQNKYDTLSGKNHKERLREDKLDIIFLDGLKNRFQTFDNLRTFVNKFIAHASDPCNRSKISKKDSEVSIALLEKCYKGLFYIAKGIELLLDDLALCDVPTPQFDQLNNWDKPIVTSEDKNKLEEYWYNRSLEIDGWSKEATEHYRSTE
jgi:hypothetical protein